MKRTPLFLCGASAALALALSGCTDVGDQVDPRDPAQLQLMTGWTADADVAAFDAIVEEFSDLRPDIRVFDESVRVDVDEVADIISARIANDNAPDSVAVSVGASLQERVEAGELQDLSHVFTTEELEQYFDTGVLDLVRHDGGLYGIPIGIQRVNVMWSNSQLLTGAGASATPGDVDAWLSDLTKLRQAGVDHPLALGDSTTQVQLFESVLIADLGADGYRSLWTDRAAWQSPGFDVALDHFNRLLDFARPGARSDSAAETISRVVTGDAAYAVLADTTLVTFHSVGLEDGLYSASPAPGTRGVFDLRADAFVLPVGATHEDAAAAWLRCVASKDGQTVFAAAKGALTGRVGIGNTFESSYQVASGWSLAHDDVVPSLAGGVAAEPSWTIDVAAAVERFVGDRKMAVFKATLLAAAANH